MADIDVVKKRSNTWMWVVLGIVVAAVLLFLLMRNNTTPNRSQLDGRQPTPQRIAVVTWNGGAPTLS